MASLLRRMIARPTAAAARWTRVGSVAARAVAASAAPARATRIAAAANHAAAAMSTAAAAKKPTAAAATAARSDFLGVVGEATDNFFDVAHARVGQDIHIPYEVTVSEGARELWQSCFYQHDRLYTSTPFAQKLNFRSHPLPFAFVLFQTVSMSHIDDRKEVLDLGFSNAVYVRPAFAGDTFKRSFYVKNVRPTSDGKGTVITVHCSLMNHNNALVFEVDKTMLFPGVENTAARKTAVEFVTSAGATAADAATSAYGQSTILPTGLSSEFEKQILQWSSTLPPTTARAYSAGQLVLHTTARPLGKSMNRSLSTLLRFQHPLLMNLARYDTELVPGPLVLGLTMAASARGLYETLFEFVQSSVLINKVEPNDTIGAVTYVHGVHDVAPGLEELRVTTLGVKNVDVRGDLTGVRVPLALFGADPKASPASPAAVVGSGNKGTLTRGVGSGPNVLTRGEAARLTAAHCPVLTDKIVSQVTRRILRQSGESPFSMALL